MPVCEIPADECQTTASSVPGKGGGGGEGLNRGAHFQPRLRSSATLSHTLNTPRKKKKTDRKITTTPR